MAVHVHRDRVRPGSLPDGDVAGHAGEGELRNRGPDTFCLRASSCGVARLRFDGCDMAGLVPRPVLLDTQGTAAPWYDRVDAGRRGARLPPPRGVEGRVREGLAAVPFSSP